ncbi:MAG: apolipoprotein N-acyltransferase, partial [Methylomonas sp.]|nr:apolipoprotein N-acyltransferase [Methylomonas sp.]
MAPLFGALLTFAFAPYDHAYLALVAPALIYASSTMLSTRRAVGVGYLFGLGLFGSGIWWVYISIHDFGGADPLSAGLLVMLLVGL